VHLSPSSAYFEVSLSVSRSVKRRNHSTVNYKSVLDRGQTDGVTALPRLHALDYASLPLASAAPRRRRGILLRE